MIGSLPALAFRQVRTRRLRALLTAFGIVLGVGMVHGVLLLSGTIRSTFDGIIDSAWGSKDLIVSPRGGEISDRQLALARATPGVRDATPMVGGIVVRLTSDGRPIRSNQGRINVAGYDTTSKTQPFDFIRVDGREPLSGAEIWLERNWARDRGISAGDDIDVGTSDGPRRLAVVGTFKFSNNLNFGGYGLAGMPLAPARQILGMPDGWMQISIRLRDRGTVDETTRRLERRLGRGVDVQTPSALGETFKEQLSALNVILYFFAGIALFVGGFLILNSFSMTVSQRIRELGMLRALGASRRMIRRSVMLEAGFLGVIGTILGLALGLALATVLIELIRGFGIPVSDVHVGAGSAALAAALGLCATAAGAWWPSRRAARVSPARAAQGDLGARGRISPRRLVLGTALFVPGVVWGGAFWFGNASAGGGSLHTILGVGMTMAMFAGMALAAPALITPLVNALCVPLARLAPTGGRLAADAIRQNPGRTASTAIALTIGLSVIVVNGAMSASFVGSVNDRIDSTYLRDLTVQPVGARAAEGTGRPISPDVQRAIAALSGAGVVSPLELAVAELPGLQGTQRMGLIEGVDPQTIAAVDRPGAEGIADAAVPAALGRGEALVGRSYAQARNLGVGDRLTLTGPEGRRTMRIAGITDVLNDFGGNAIRVSSSVFRDIYGATGVAQLLVRARSEHGRDALARSVDALLRRDHPELEALSTGQVKKDIQAEIDQQFALFNGIVAIAVIVSLLGVINTLAMSVVERTREIGVLRALGSSRRLVRFSMIFEGLLITLSGAIAGLALGFVIAFAWVRSLDSLIPNIAFHLPVETLVAVTVAAVVLGTLAAALPARRAARLDVVDALAYE